jgi:hypothetical protein
MLLVYLNLATDWKACSAILFNLTRRYHHRRIQSMFTGAGRVKKERTSVSANNTCLTARRLRVPLRHTSSTIVLVFPEEDHLRKTADPARHLVLSL